MSSFKTHADIQTSDSNISWDPTEQITSFDSLKQDTEGVGSTLRTTLTSDRVNSVLAASFRSQGLRDLQFAAQPLDSEKVRYRKLLSQSYRDVEVILDTTIDSIREEATKNAHEDIHVFLFEEIIPNKDLLIRLFLHEEDSIVSATFSKIIHLLNSLLLKEHMVDFTTRIPASDNELAVGIYVQKIWKYGSFFRSLKSEIESFRSSLQPDLVSPLVLIN